MVMLCCDLNFSNDFECASDGLKTVTVAAFCFLNLTHFSLFYRKS